MSKLPPVGSTPSTPPPIPKGSKPLAKESKAEMIAKGKIPQKEEPPTAQPVSAKHTASEKTKDSSEKALKQQFNEAFEGQEFVSLREKQEEKFDNMLLNLKKELSAPTESKSWHNGVLKPERRQKLAKVRDNITSFQTTHLFKKTHMNPLFSKSADPKFEVQDKIKDFTEKMNDMFKHSKVLKSRGKDPNYQSQMSSLTSLIKEMDKYYDEAKQKLGSNDPLVRELEEIIGSAIDIGNPDVY